MDSSGKPRKIKGNIDIVRVRRVLEEKHALLSCFLCDLLQFTSPNKMENPRLPSNNAIQHHCTKFKAKMAMFVGKSDMTYVLFFDIRI